MQNGGRVELLPFPSTGSCESMHFRSRLHIVTVGAASPSALRRTRPPLGIVSGIFFAVRFPIFSFEFFLKILTFYSPEDEFARNLKVKILYLKKKRTKTIRMFLRSPDEVFRVISSKFSFPRERPR